MGHPTADPYMCHPTADPYMCHLTNDPYMCHLTADSYMCHLTTDPYNGVISWLTHICVISRLTHICVISRLGHGHPSVWGQSTPWGPWSPKADILEGVGGGAPHDKCQGVWGGGSPPTLGPIWAQVGAKGTKKQKNMFLWPL